MDNWVNWLIAFVIFMTPDVLLFLFGAAAIKQYKKYKKRKERNDKIDAGW